MPLSVRPSPPGLCTLASLAAVKNVLRLTHSARSLSPEHVFQVCKPGRRSRGHHFLWYAFRISTQPPYALLSTTPLFVPLALPHSRSLLLVRSSVTCPVPIPRPTPRLLARPFISRPVLNAHLLCCRILACLCSPSSLTRLVLPRLLVLVACPLTCSLPGDRQLSRPLSCARRLSFLFCSLTIRCCRRLSPAAGPDAHQPRLAPIFCSTSCPCALSTHCQLPALALCLLPSTTHRPAR